MPTQNKECPTSLSLRRRISFSLVAMSWILPGQPVARGALHFNPVAAAGSGKCQKP